MMQTQDPGSRQVDLRATIERLITGRQPGGAAAYLRAPLRLCSWAYWLAVAGRTALYQKGLLPREQLACPVIAVGNISVGGTGKTPTVCHLARQFVQRDCRVVVLTRGYRGRLIGEPQIVSDRHSVLLSADAVGDEACMLARKLPGVPVIAGKDRVAAGLLAATRFLPDMIIMDDGFQYHRLERSLDIVLINGRNPFGNGFLLPRGPLREPLSALRRAGVIMLTKTSSAGDSSQKLAASLRHYNAHAPLFSSQVHPGRLYDAHTLRDIPREHMAGRRIVALCSIGDPESFFEMLAGLHPAVLERLAFADHHLYGPADYGLIRSRAEQADYLITTEKDIAKLEIPMLQNHKLLVLCIELTIEREEAFLKQVQQACGIG